jgi:hypothetical protein
LVGAARSRNLPSIGRGRHPPGDRSECFYKAYYAQQLQSVDGDLSQADPTDLTTRGFCPGARDLSDVAGGFRGCRALLTRRLWAAAASAAQALQPRFPQASRDPIASARSSASTQAIPSVLKMGRSRPSRSRWWPNGRFSSRATQYSCSKAGFGSGAAGRSRTRGGH